MTSLLQQRIIINISVGAGFAEKVIDFEDDSGKIVKRPIYQAIYDVILFTCGRSDSLLFTIFPELVPYAILPKDRRC